MRPKKHRPVVTRCLHSLTGWLCRIALGAFAIGMVGSAVVLAAVPASLAPQQQEASVEAIIAALEQKARQAGTGVWAFDIGPQDQPGVAYTTGVSDAGWYLRRVAGEPFLLASKGREFFETPSRIRYAIDGVSLSQNGQYGLGAYLIHANLRPRQFLGSLPLQNMGEVTLDGVTYTKLSARNKVGYAEGGAPSRIRRIDYLYDPAKRAIVQSVLATKTNQELRCDVTAWDRFGTASDWPQRLTGRRVNASVTPPSPLAQPLLTLVSGFTPVQDPGVAVALAEVDAVAFFSGVPNYVHIPAVYTGALQQTPQELTERVFLAQSLFASNRPKAGLEQWQALEERVAAGPDRELLARALAVPAAGSMQRRALDDPAEGPACVQVLQRVLDTPLSDSEWSAVSAHVAEAWRAMLDRGSLAQQAAALEPVLVPRIAERGSYRALKLLVGLAERRGASAESIDNVLTTVAARPLPIEGLAGTQQSKLIALTIRDKHWARTRRYVEALQWHAQTPDSARVPSTLIQALLGELDPQEPKAQDAARLVGYFSQTTDPNFAADELMRDACRLFAGRAGVRLIRVGISKGVTPSQFVAAAANNPADAQAYWDSVIGTLLGLALQGTEATGAIDLVHDLAVACQQQLGTAEYESRTWIRIAKSRLAKTRAFSPMQRVEYLNRGFAAASSDPVRLETMREIVAILEQSAQHEQAEQAVEGLGTSMQTEAGAAGVTALLAAVREDRTNFAAEIREREEKAEIDRINGQIAHLQERLAEAEAQDKAEGELQALRTLIEQAEDELQALTATSND